MKDASLSHLELRYLTSHRTDDILNEYAPLDPVRAMKQYFAAIRPLLEAIAERASALGLPTRHIDELPGVLDRSAKTRVLRGGSYLCRRAFHRMPGGWPLASPLARPPGHVPRIGRDRAEAERRPGWCTSGAQRVHRRLDMPRLKERLRGRELGEAVAFD